MTKTILITRPKGDEVAFRDALLGRGFRAICEPLTEIFLNHTVRLEVENAMLGEPDAVLVTSKHGVQSLALLTELRDMFLLCVGKNTAELATDLGFTRVSFAGETVEQLLEYISDCYDEGARFVYISGEHINTDIEQVLAVQEMAVKRIIAYQAIATEALSDTLIEQLKRGQIDGVSFMSPRAAQIFISLAQKNNLLKYLQKIDAFCLSDAIAKACEITAWNGIYISDEPTLASMINKIDNAYK